MADKDTLNFYKISTLLIDIGAKILTKRIEEYCNQKALSFEALLNDINNKNTLFHLWKPTKCCILHCNTIRKKTVIQTPQWEKLYLSNTPTAGHTRKDPRGKPYQSCLCAFSAVGGVKPMCCDVTLASCLLKSVCSLSPREIKCVDSLRELRNTLLAHANESKLSDAEFHHNWQLIESVTTSIASYCDASVRADIQQEIDRIKSLPFIDNTALQILISELQRLRGQEICLFEALKDSAEKDTDPGVLQTSCGQNVQRITEAELDIKTNDYYKTRAFDAGIRCVKKNGITIFTGISGSGKSCNSLQILRKVKEGQMFDERHLVKHINIEQWDLQVDLRENTVVFLEDPLGKTNANRDLILNDGGRFRKIWASLQNGKIKVIITIRSNILRENKDILKDFELFQQKHIIDLSEGEFALDKEEKTGLIKFFCSLHSIEISDTACDPNIPESPNTSVPRNISLETIRRITNVNPPIGFPLCCKYFVENNNNIHLKDRFFSQPTDFILEELKCLALNDNDKEKRQFAVLVYMLLNEETIDTQNIDMQKMEDIAEELALSSMKTIHTQTAIQKLNGKYIFNTDNDESQFSILHATIVESIFIICGTKLSELLRKVLMHCNIKTLCEIIRTENMITQPNEKVCKLKKTFYKALATRFVQEIQKGHIRYIAPHLSLNDEIFLLEFVKTLQQVENREIIYKATDDNYSSFHRLCLFDRSLLIQHILHENWIPQDVVFEGCQTCIEFNNVETVKKVLPYLSAEQIGLVFECSCKKGKTESCNLIIHLGKPFLSSENLQRGFIILCGDGNLKSVEAVLKSEINIDFSKGFEKACQNGHVNILELLINKLPKEERCLEHGLNLPMGFLKSCEAGQTDVSMYILSHMTHHDIQQEIVKACQKGNRKTLSKIIQSKYVTDYTVLQCLLAICESKEKLNSKPQTKKDVQCSHDDGDFYSFGVEGMFQRHSIHVDISHQDNRDFYPSGIEGTSRLQSEPFRSLMSDCIDLLPGMQSHTNLARQFQNSSQQIKAFLVRSILQCRTNLIDQAADVLIKACQFDRSEIVYVILKQRKNLSVGQIVSALHVACVNNKTPDTIKVLLENRQDIPSDTIFNAFLVACKSGHGEKVHNFLEIVSDLPDEHVAVFLLHLWDTATENYLASASQRESINCKSAIEHILYKRSNIDKPMMNVLTKTCIFRHNTIFKILMMHSDVRKLQSEAKICPLQFSDALIEKIVENRKDVSPEQICQCTVTFCGTNRSVYTSVLYLFIKIRHELNTDQVLPLLLQLCSYAENDASIVNCVIHQKPDLTPEQVHACLLKLCSNKCVGATAINTCLQERLKRKEMTNDEVFECLYEICSRDICDSTMVKVFLQEKIELTTQQVYGCLFRLCSNACAHTSAIDTFLQQRPCLSTNQLCKCLMKACSMGNGNVHIIKVFLEKKSVLMTDDVYHCLFKLCSNRYVNISIIETFLQQRRDMSTDQVHQCLLQLCSNDIFNASIIKLFLHERSDLSTDQVQQCLFKFLSTSSDNTAAIQTFLQEMSVDQVCHCLLDIYSNDICDAPIIIKLFLQQKQSDMTTDHVYRCLLGLCSRSPYNTKAIEIFLHERPDISTNQIYQCLLELCSNEIVCDDSIKLLFTREKSNMTTVQVQACLLKLCSNRYYNKSVIQIFLQEGKNMSTSQVYLCLQEICSNCNCIGSSFTDMINLFRHERPDLTEKHIQHCLHLQVTR